MIHLGRTDSAGVLQMTSAAVLNVGMKCGRLFAQIGGGGRMATDASGCFYTPRRRVTRFALSSQEAVLF